MPASPKPPVATIAAANPTKVFFTKVFSTHWLSFSKGSTLRSQTVSVHCDCVSVRVAGGEARDPFALPPGVGRVEAALPPARLETLIDVQ